MIRVRDDQFHEVRKRAIGDGLVASFAGSGFRSSRESSTGDVIAEDPLGRRTRFVFDRRGFVEGVVSPMGRRWGIESDARGRPKSFSNPAGMRLDIDLDPDGQIVRIGRDGRLVCEINREPLGEVAGYHFADGTSTRIDRDPTGRVARMTDRLGFARDFEHDGQGRLRAMTDPLGRRTQFDPGRVTYPDGSTVIPEHGPDGLPIAITAADETRLVIARDDQGRPLSIVDDDGDVSTFAYDDSGRLTLARNATATIRFEYDAEGRLIAESQGDDVVSYEYDEAGTLVAMIYPTGERSTFARDDDLRLIQVTDWDGGAYRFEHASDDRWLTIKAPGGLVSLVELTVEGQVSEIAVRAPVRPSTSGGLPSGGEDLFVTSYRYDDEDRLALVEDSEHGERRYRYDAEGRVIESGRETFAYDPVGNRVRAGSEVAEFDPADRLLSQGAIRCEYDPRGNLVGWSDPSETWRFRYDARDRMTRAEGRSGRVVTFGYDALGRRAWKRSADLTTRFFWAGEQLIREVRSDGASRDYLYPPGSPTPLAIRDRGTIYTVHADHLGTPRRLTDPRGAVAWSADFDAFGVARVSASIVTNPIRFPGHYFDEETGLHYNRFRYYSPRLGRYLSRDPASYLGGLNLYAYAQNDPINEMDPTGLWPSWRTVLPVVAAVAVGVAVVMLAPVALPLAIIAAGAAAGAVGAGLNQALHEEKFCAFCIAKAALKGALVGAVAAVPFALLPATAGVAAFAGVGGLSGAISYTGNHFLNPGSPWSWGGLAASVGIGAVTAGAGRYLGGRWLQSSEGSTPVEETSPSQPGADRLETPTRTLNDPLPRHPNKPTQADPHAPDPEATGPHTVIGTRTDPKQSPEPYRQGITYDADGNPLGRTDVTTHGRGDHPNPHYHPYDPTIKNPFDPDNPGNFGPQGPMPE